MDGLAVSEDMFPLHARLYDNSVVDNLNLDEVADHLRDKGIFDEVEVREAFPENYGEEIDEIAKRIAETRVVNLEVPEMEFEPDGNDIEFERKFLTGEISGLTGALYDGFRLSKIFTDLIREGERSESYMHVVFSDRFFATWKPATQRYHARVSVYGFPSIVSTSGIVDAPARPFGSYRFAVTDDVEVVEGSGKAQGDFVDYNDERLTDIMKGYAMQCVFYHLHLGPFCDEKDCALYNPHLQKNILRSKLSEPEFCDEHRRVLEELRGAVIGEA